MKAPLLLRIAAIISFLYFAGHTAGMPWTPAVGPAEAPVIEAMKSRVFDAMGAQRSYWDFYFGFGVIISAFLLALSVVLWQLGALARNGAAPLRPVIASLLVMFVANAILGWVYFFAVPAVMAAAIAVCLVLALVAARRG